MGEDAEKKVNLDNLKINLDHNGKEAKHNEEVNVGVVVIERTE
jgi:hypothetical protein